MTMPDVIAQVQAAGQTLLEGAQAVNDADNQLNRLDFMSQGARNDLGPVISSLGRMASELETHAGTVAEVETSANYVKERRDEALADIHTGIRQGTAAADALEIAAGQGGSRVAEMAAQARAATQEAEGARGQVAGNENLAVADNLSGLHERAEAAVEAALAAVKEAWDAVEELSTLGFAATELGVVATSPSLDGVARGMGAVADQALNYNGA